MSYDANKNYAQEIKDAISNGASSKEVAQLQSERNEKIAANSGHYSSIGVSANDSYGQAASDYVSSNDAANNYLAANSGRGGGSSASSIKGTNLTGQYPTYQGMTFQDYLDQSGYSKYQKQMQDYVKAMVDKAVNGYQTQIDTANQDSDKLAQQAYVAKMLGEKNLDQKLSASGYAGGMADSQRIQSESNYQNNLNDIETQRTNTVKQLQQAISDAQLTGDMQTAQSLSQQLSSLQSQWSSYVQQQESMNNTDYWNQKQMDNADYWNQQNMNWDQKQLDNQNYWNQQNLDTQNQATARTNAMELLSAGIMPDSQTLNAAGLTQTEAAAIRSVYLNGAGTTTGTATATKTTGASGSGTSGGGISGYNNGSLTTAQVQQLQSKLGVNPDGLWGSASSKAAGGLTAEQAWAKYGGGGMNANSFAAFGQSVAAQLASGKSSAAVSNIDQNWANLSTAQRQQIQALLAKYGVGYSA